MSDTDFDIPAVNTTNPPTRLKQKRQKQKGRRRKKRRPSIPLPDGDTLEPRAQFAEDIDVSERTITRMNPLTTYVGGVAYIRRNATLQLIADSVKRRNQPPRHRSK